MTDIAGQLDEEEAAPVAPEPVIKMRAGQRRLFRLVDEYRMLAFVARRQAERIPRPSSIRAASAASASSVS